MFVDEKNELIKPFEDSEYHIHFKDLEDPEKMPAEVSMASQIAELLGVDVENMDKDVWLALCEKLYYYGLDVYEAINNLEE